MKAYLPGLLKQKAALTIGRYFRVNPARQDISILQNVLQLSDIFPSKDLIEEIVMPKLLDTLMVWIGHASCEVKEVWQWY